MARSAITKPHISHGGNPLLRWIVPLEFPRRTDIPIRELRRWIEAQRKLYSDKEAFIRKQRKSGEMTAESAKRMREHGRLHRHFLRMLELRLIQAGYGRQIA